jgi:hypothetical protein
MIITLGILKEEDVVSVLNFGLSIVYTLRANGSEVLFREKVVKEEDLVRSERDRARSLIEGLEDFTAHICNDLFELGVLMETALIEKFFQKVDMGLSKLFLVTKREETGEEGNNGRSRGRLEIEITS